MQLTAYYVEIHQILNYPQLMTVFRLSRPYKTSAVETVSLNNLIRDLRLSRR